MVPAVGLDPTTEMFPAEDLRVFAELQAVQLMTVPWLHYQEGIQRDLIARQSSNSEVHYQFESEDLPDFAGQQDPVKSQTQL